MLLRKHQHEQLQNEDDKRLHDVVRGRVPNRNDRRVGHVHDGVDEDPRRVVRYLGHLEEQRRAVKGDLGVLVHPQEELVDDEHHEQQQDQKPEPLRERDRLLHGVGDHRKPQRELLERVAKGRRRALGALAGRFLVVAPVGAFLLARLALGGAFLPTLVPRFGARLARFAHGTRLGLLGGGFESVALPGQLALYGVFDLRRLLDLVFDLGRELDVKLERSASALQLRSR